MTAADLYQALTATGQYIVQAGRTRHDPADEEGLHSVIIDGTFDLHALAAAIAPVRSALPREDADLDAIEARANAATPGPWHYEPMDEPEMQLQQWFDAEGELHWKGGDGWEEDAEFIAHAREDVPALIARVRTTEAERDAAQRRLGVIADSAQDGLADSDDDHDMSALWVLTVATGQDEADTEPRPLASRTVETAEEWEGVLVGEGGVTLPYYVDRNQQLRTISVARDRQRWERDGWTVRERAAEPVPPTPETEESDRG